MRQAARALNSSPGSTAREKRFEPKRESAPRRDAQEAKAQSLPEDDVPHWGEGVASIIRRLQ